MSTELIQADIVKWLKGNQWLVNNGHIDRFHCVLGDPPYGIEFMSKKWDKFDGRGKFHVPAKENRVFTNDSGHYFDNMTKPLVRFTAGVEYQAWVTEWATLLLDYVYPGAVLALFGGTRTYHRLAAGLEDAGWEVFDCMMYLYGSGFPKATDLGKMIDKSAGAEREVIGVKQSPGRIGRKTYGKGETEVYGTFTQHEGGFPDTAPATPAAQQWDGYKTALKPAWESIVLCRSPRGSATYAELAQTWGTGALNVDGGRIGTDEMHTNGWRTDGQAIYGNGKGLGSDGYRGNSSLGRYPANLALDEAAARLLDAQSGELTSGTKSPSHARNVPRLGKGGIYGDDTGTQVPREWAGDSGGASRFFYTAKAAAWEREAGLIDFNPAIVNDGRDTPIDNAYQRGVTKRRNTHPTVKSINLCQWLATLLLPPPLDVPRRVLVPFAGSGSEMIGAQLAGWDEIVGIEREAEYCAINEARRRWWAKFKTYEQAEMAYRPPVETTDDLSDLPLFAAAD